MGLRACWNVVGGGERVLGGPHAGTGVSFCTVGRGLQTRQPCWGLADTPGGSLTSAGPTLAFLLGRLGVMGTCAGQVGQGVNMQRLRGDTFHPGYGRVAGKDGAAERSRDWRGCRWREREGEGEGAMEGREGKRAKQEKTCTERGCPGSGPAPGPSSAPPGLADAPLLSLQVTLVLQPVPLSAG